MNGAVFQVSAMITAIWAWKPSVDHRICLLRMSLATPLALKIHFHSRAETTVGMAHGTRMLARIRPRPLNAWFMISAIATPMTTSMTHADDGEEGGDVEGVPEAVAALAPLKIAV